MAPNMEKSECLFFVVMCVCFTFLSTQQSQLVLVCPVLQYSVYIHDMCVVELMIM